MEQPKGHFSSTPPRSANSDFTSAAISVPAASTRILYPRFRFFAPGRRPMRHSGSSKLCNRNLVLNTQTRNKRYSISTIASNCETIFTPVARSRDKANETRNDSSRKNQETTTPLARESVSQPSEPWDGCRIVPALRVENRFWQKEVSRAEVAVWVLSMIRNFRIYTNRFNAHSPGARNPIGRRPARF